MMEAFVLLGLLIAVVALMEHNHHRTVQLSRTPFALDLEVEGSADRRREADDFWALERAYGADAVLAGARERREAVRGERRAALAHHARARWI